MKRVIKILAILSLLVAIILTVSCCRPPSPEPPEKTKISPPIVNPPLYQCATAVTVQGFIPGATIDIYADVTTHIGGAISDSPWGQSFSVSPDLVAGQKITATQTYSGVTSQPSALVEVMDYFQIHPEGLTKPIQDTPIYNCGGALGVRNLVEGGRLEVYADGNLVGSANGCGAGQWVFINPNFTTGQKVYSIETLCSQVGPKSDLLTVQPEPVTLPTLTVGDIYEGGKYVNVYNITNGALVSVFNGIQQVAGHPCSGGGQVFRLNPIPLVGDGLTATQSICNTISDPSDTITVRPCNELPAPKVHKICINDTYIAVSGTAPDAQIRIYSNGSLIGNGGGNNIVPITPLSVGMVITATQALGNCVSPPSSTVTVTSSSAPSYNPSIWNNPNWIRCNNCYNYACDIRTDNYAQPGYAHGVTHSTTCPTVTVASIADGLIVGNEKECRNCTHHVALVIAPNEDYHWYRLDDNGRWSHKMASFPVSDRDGSGNLIINPETADRRAFNGPDFLRDYSIFCGYFCVDKNNVVIKGWNSCN